jgi:hypothetical protein
MLLQRKNVPITATKLCHPRNDQEPGKTAVEMMAVEIPKSGIPSALEGAKSGASHISTARLRLNGFKNKDKDKDKNKNLSPLRVLAVPPRHRSWVASIAAEMA